MEYDKIKNSFKQIFEAKGYYGIDPKANYYLNYKEEGNSISILRAELNAIIDDKGNQPYYELVLMEDEYFVSYNDLINNVDNNNNSLQKLPCNSGNKNLGRIIYNNEDEAKNDAKCHFGGSLIAKDILT